MTYTEEHKEGTLVIYYNHTPGEEGYAPGVEITTVWYDTMDGNEVNITGLYSALVDITDKEIEILRKNHLI